MNDNSKGKYVIFKGLYWNHPISYEKSQMEEITLIHIEMEKKMLQKAGTLNFLANENILKHKELVTYLEDNLGELIEFRLNEEPFILADYELRKPISDQNVKDILNISGVGIYQVIKLNDEFDGKYIAIISENCGFESESGNFKNFIFSNQIEAEIGLTKYIFHQISNLYTNFTRIKESESKTTQFKLFIEGLEYFEFYEGYLVIQPKKEISHKFELYNSDEILKVKYEIDFILSYTQTKAYEIIPI